MCELLEQLVREGKTLTVTELTTKCRYHRNIQERYALADGCGDFRCLELFHALYPRLLALMYGAVLPVEELTLSCPDVGNTVTVCLVTKPPRSIVRRIINRVKQWLLFIRPMDIVKVDVWAEVLSVTGNCRAGYRKGDRLEVRYRGGLCPQSLYSVFPLILLDGDNTRCRCPSHVNQVTFQAGK